ncbi:sushi, von Willebrand factor type A, EGF and pentraxin domain-containing protein 1-like [Branchiostoma lanceolatum]|uniref:sushi, von Willebrand factor type A, EGF and pentraxin domain-containing protein 1-like n=1 Tax=Branchiostoma lanceolatum TaxID=7740 RepID=UPI003454848A
MSSSSGSPKLLLRAKSTHGPTKTTWTTRCDHLLPRGDLTGRTRSRRTRSKPQHKTTATVPTEAIVQLSIRSARIERSFMWRDFHLPEELEAQTIETPNNIKGSDNKDMPTDPVQPQDLTDYQWVAVKEKDPPFEKGDSQSKEIEHSVSVDSMEKEVPLKRHPSSDSLFTGKHIKPDAVWTPYGPPLYGYSSSLNPPPRKGPDTLVLLAAIFYCLAALTAVVFVVLFKTNVVPLYTSLEPVPAWVQQFSPKMQRWYRLALAGGRDASEIQPPATVQWPTEVQPPGSVQQPTEALTVEELCGITSVPESLPDLHHGYFNCTNIAYYNIYVRMCRAKCQVGYQTDDAGLLFCNRGRWAPIEPEVVSTLVGVGRAADAMPNTDPRVFEYLGITDEIYADVARNILVKLDEVPNLSLVVTYLNMVSQGNIIDFNMMRQMLIWVGPDIKEIVANLDFLELLSHLETFGASRRPVCRLVDCGQEFGILDHGKVNISTTTYKSEARVVCDRGYLPRHTALTCNATGQWDKAAVCDLVTCDPPEDPPHGSYLCQGHVFSDRCDVSCDVGYLPETEDTLRCSWTGNWTTFTGRNTTEMEHALSADVIIPKTLACVIADCGNIFMPAHGDVTCTGKTYGETCHLTCHDGYEQLSQKNFTCQVRGDTAQATWSGKPECTPVSCGAPPKFPNTDIQCAGGHTYGDTCGVSCADGHERTNHQDVICHSTGNWSLQTGAFQRVVGETDLLCQKKDCGNLTTPANGSLTCNGTRYQDSCRLTCEPGYKVADESGHLLHSLYNFTCLASGQWNKKPKCVPSNYCQLGLHDCHPEHGICIYTGHRKFSCRCRVGTVGNGTHCQRTPCPPFPIAEPSNGFFRCSIPGTSSSDAGQSANSTAAEYEVVCLLHCNPGYDRLIYAEYSCGNNGNWTIPVDLNSTRITPCLAVKCPDLSRPSHGGITCSSGYEFRYPEACNFACGPGYELTLSSSPTRQCQTNATWSGNDVECIGVKCPDLSDPLNGGMTCDRGASFRYPESCNFTCAPGYQLTTEPVRHCQTNATWSEDDATCIGVQCPALLTPTNGGMTCDNGSSFRHPENCSFTCNHGYEIHTGNDSRICEADGTWSGSSASCRGKFGVI